MSDEKIDHAAESYVIESLLPRIRDKYTVDAETGCWVWHGSKEGGYGLIWTGKRVMRAHRVTYEIHRGAIGGGLQIDHLCRNRACVNPDHLEPVTQHENILRGAGTAAANARKTHCPSGHPLSGPNVIHTRQGWRRCKTCVQAQEKARPPRLSGARAQQVREGNA